MRNLDGRFVAGYSGNPSGRPAVVSSETRSLDRDQVPTGAMGLEYFLQRAFLVTFRIRSRAMVDDWLSLIGNMNGALRDLRRAAAEVMRTFSDMARAAHTGNSLGGKTKEFVALATGVATRCAPVSPVTLKAPSSRLPHAPTSLRLSPWRSCRPVGDVCRGGARSGGSMGGQGRLPSPKQRVRPEASGPRGHSSGGNA
jgi:hypothetical protein